MPNIRTHAKSFNGGELTPEFFGQITDSKYQTGLARAFNMEVLPHGPVANAAGTKYVRTVKYNNKNTRTISFTYSTEQTMVLEFGEYYVRFHTAGATLLSPTPSAWSNATAYVVGDLVLSSSVKYYCILAHTNQAPPNATYWYALPATGEYEIPTPYASADIFSLNTVQSADVLTIVHQNYAPRELRRYGATDWRLTTITFASEISAPGSVSAVASGGSSPTTYSYKVTAVGDTGQEESLPSSLASCTNNLLTTGYYNTVSWASVSGATRYNVYKESNGLYGYIGQTDGTSFKDENITADVSKTPPIQNTPFSGSSNYPGAVSYFEQRRVFGGTINKKNNIWMTRSGTESNLAYSIPVRDDDAISFRVATREANTIRHIIPLTNLILLTSSAVGRVTSVNSDAITPTTISVRPQSNVGASNVQPVVVNNNLVYPAARGGHLRELAYAWQANGYVTGDLSIRAPHLFNGYTIKDMAFSEAPYPVIWCVSSTGKLLGLTYVPEQQIGAWHQHATYTNAGDVDSPVQSNIKSCCVVTESDEDALYMVVERVINGSTVQYIERKQPRRFTDLEDAFFVHCGATYSGAPASTISGLTWLEGETVSILADGAVHPQRTVVSGAITLDRAYSKVQVGLPYNSEIQLLPLAFEAQAFGQGRQKNVNKVWLRVYESSGIFAGPSFDKLVEAKQRTTEPYGSPPELKSKEVPIVLTPQWNDNGQVCIRQSDPLPLLITSMALEVSVGA
jgi:hypothetical protein